MKITVAFTPGEELAARTVEEFARAIFPTAKVRKSDLHPPFRHIYITTKIPKKRCENKKNA